MTTDEKYMARCLQLAANGRYDAAPNPMVGAVIVHNDHIIGEGFHRQCGKPHAEVNAIRSVEDEELLASSTIYVSLEPCAHYGKTPPCADLIIEKRIPRVVVGCRDNFSLVDGKGIERMRNAGIEVTVGVLEKECQALNRTFFTYHTRKRPYITLKWAQTADHFIDTKRDEGTPVRLSSVYTQQRVHRYRALSDAILVGRRTALLDNPSLTTRLWPGNSPIRVVIDGKGCLPPTLNLFDGSVKTIVYTHTYRPTLVKTNVEQVVVNDEQLCCQRILDDMYQRGIQRLLVEGGACVHQQFIDAGLWDEAIVETSPLELKEGIVAATLKEAQLKYQEICFGHTIRHFSHEMEE